MKAVQVSGPKDVKVIEKEIPVIKHGGDVLVKVKRVGICGSDMHIYHGNNPMATYPRIIGHEIAGEIVETGNEVTHVQKGDKVVLDPIQYCGKCHACRHGRQNVCENLQVYGVHIDGGYQEFVVFPADNIHKVSDRLKWDEAVLVEPFTIGAQANWRGKVQDGDTVFIMGAGTVGLTVLKIAKLNGAVCIISDLSDEKLRYAKEEGADYTLNVTQVNAKEEVNRITEHEGANVVVDAVGTITNFEDAVQLSSMAGHVVTLGFNGSPSEIAQLSITQKELTIAGSRLQADKFPEVISYFDTGEINTESFVTHHFKLEEFQKAVAFMESHPEDVRKVVLEVNG